MRRPLLLVVVVVVALLASACGGEELAARAGFNRTPAPTIGDISVLDFAGSPAEPVPTELRADPGQLLVLYLGFLSCPDVCPLTLADISRSYLGLDDAVLARLQTGFLTVDPGRDTGEEIESYVSNFFDQHHALRAPDGDTLALVLDRLSATAEIEEHEPGDENYGVAHSTVTYVVDADGAVIWEFPYGTSDTDMAAALTDLVGRPHRLMLVGVMIAAASVLAPAVPDGADLLVGSVPAAGDVVTDVPDVIEFDFAAPVGEVEVRLLDDRGQVILVGTVDDPDTALALGDVSASGVEPGSVVVAWSAPSVDAQGAFRFTVDPTGDSAVLVDRAATAATQSLRVSRVLMAALAGAAVLIAASAVARRSERPVLVWAGIGSVASLAGTALAGVAADGGPLDALSPSSWADGLADGRLWLVPIAALAGLVFASTAERGARAGLLVSALVGVAGAGWLVVSSADLDRSRSSFSERLTAEAGSIELVVEPAVPGVNEVHLYGFSPQGSLLVLSDASMWATNLDQDVGPLSVPVIRAGSNHFLTYSAVLPFAGRWN